MAVGVSGARRAPRVVAVVAVVLLALCGLTAGVLARYVGTSAEKTVTVGVVGQWSSEDASQAVFPVDVYVRAYVTTGLTTTDADGASVVDGTNAMVAPTPADGSSWKALASDPYCFYYVGDDGVVTGGQLAPVLELSGDEPYKVVYEYLEAGVTNAGNLTCQAAWGVTIDAGTVR